MDKIFELVLLPEQAADVPTIEGHVLRKAQCSAKEFTVRILRRSIDARSKQPKVRISAKVYKKADAPALITYQIPEKNVQNAPEILIIGSGPAGLFAALKLIESGYRPIILERGEDVRTRRRAIAAINKDHIVNPDSNYCFGEGGAGTYSDGKLYTRSKKRGDIKRILEILVAHGTREDILYEAHPHIGTNKLPGIIAEIRETILSRGGAIHFNTQVTDFIITNKQITGVLTAKGDTISGQGLILATGHSARDIFELFEKKSLAIEAKPFALGVRVEHPQALIDRFQYHCKGSRGDYLPAAPYSLTHQHEGRGVFSFCMCPGGFIVPAATSPGEVVMNGMSPSRRDSRFANSGIVVSVNLEDFAPGALSGMHFQAAVEKKACELAGGNQSAPAQRLTDFLEGKVSQNLPEMSYQPGAVPVDLGEVLPEHITRALKAGFLAFEGKMRGYLTEEAVVLGVESRTSSPVRIPRDGETLEHPQIRRLFPCGEGGGYAGGIVSAAMDGERCADAWIRMYG